MRVWLFKDGESLPLEEGSRRMRNAMLAEALRREGHEVHWFSSTFMHGPKRVFAEHDVISSIAPGLTLHLVHAGGFQRNISIERYRFHRRYARRLRRYCASLASPEIIVCAFPLIDVASWAVRYSHQIAIPIIVDVRDLWPDTIVEVFPAWARPLAKMALKSDFRRAAAVMRGATAITAMSEGVLRWALRYAGRTQNADDRVFPIGFPQFPTRVQTSLTPSLRARLPALETHRIFTYVGTFGHTYDLRGILDAARRLLASNDDHIHFVLGGTGPLLATIREAVRDLPNVSVPGWLDQSDIRSLLSHSTAGLLPWAGLDDAMPNKFFEYVSSGLPVISSARGELNQLITDEKIGFAVPVGDGEAWAEVVRLLGRDSATQKEMSTRASETFTARFREDLIYRDFATHIAELWQRGNGALGVWSTSP